ncbi:unnamed protein product, partial [Prorocentrum cordatum]
MSAGRPRRRRRAHLAGAAALAGGGLALGAGRPSGTPPRRGSPLLLGFVASPAVPRSLEPGRRLADQVALQETRLACDAAQPSAPPRDTTGTPGALHGWRALASRLRCIFDPRFSYIVCAMMGVNFALACRGGAGGLAAAALRAPGGQAALVAASAGLTSFGGSTQSTLLLRLLGQRFQANTCVEAEQRRFIWQDPSPHLWASLGVMLAVGIHLWTGRLLDGCWWRWAVALNSALFTVHAVGGSGWFADGSPRSPLLRMVGTFLYLCGGGFWRDILG